MNYNKDAGSDGIVAEILKFGSILLWERIFELLTDIWEKERMDCCNNMPTFLRRETRRSVKIKEVYITYKK